MCGGNKGQSTTSQATNQNQTSTYTPNAQAAGYINNALQQGQSAAATPFSAPQAPVAGFSQDQLGAFQQFRDLQGAGQQNFQNAANYFSPQGTQDFYNPYAANVTANLKDIFGAQQAQTTGQLTQAAGGVGADRIAVGQAELAKQQGLTAGQTYANLWQSAAQQAQSAGQGQMALGQNAFNRAYQGANSLLGVGGLQQQLNQAQLNSPYQQQLAQLAYPFQTAQFNAGITGALAPGLGGTTNSYGYGNTNGTSNPAQPSIWSQLLGAGVAGAGIYGGLGGTSFGGNPSYGGDGTFGSGNGVYGGSSSNPLPGLSASDYGAGYASGGEVEEPPMDAGVSTRPINIAGHSFVPDTQLTPIKANIPQASLNLTPPQQQQQSGGSGGGIGDIVSTAAKFLPLLLNRGGGVGRNPYGYAEGGDVFGDDNRMAGFDLLRQGMGTRAPDSIPGGEPPPDEQPYRLAGPEAMEKWRNGVAADQGAGMTAAGSEAPISIAGRPQLPRAITGDPDSGEGSALGYAPDARPRAGAGAGAPAPNGQGLSPFSPEPATNLEATSGRDPGFIGSPWAALTAAGLGMMAGTSPYAGVNIGAGGQQALKTLQTQRETSQKDETIDQSARRLALEAKHHEDQYTRETMGQKLSREQADRPYHELTAYQKAQLDSENWKPIGSIQTKDGIHPLVYDSKSKQAIDLITGEPPAKTDAVIPKGGSKNSPEEIGHVVDSIIDGSQPPTLNSLYGDAVHVRSGLHAKKFDLAKAQLEYKQAEKQIQALNGPQMMRGYNLYKSVNSTIDEVKDLSQQLQLGGVPILNKLELNKYIQTQGNSEKGQLALRYMTAVNTLKEEFANLANGGYAPTEPAWKLANEQVNGNYGVKALGASLDEIKRLVNYRMKFVAESPVGPGSSNRYTGQGADKAPGATAPPPGGGHGGGTKPDVTTRFNELIGGGKSEEETYAILKEEGYK